METHANPSSDDELSGALRSAVMQARRQTPPPDAKPRALRQIALALAEQTQSSPRSGAQRNLLLAFASLAALLLVGLLLYRTTKPQQHPLVANPNIPATTSRPMALPPNLGHPDARAGISADGLKQLGAVTFGSRGTRSSSRGIQAGASVSRFMAIAGNSTVIASTGGDNPISLGDAIPNDPEKNRLHIWNWRTSKTSRVLPIDAAGPMALSPDGNQIVTADGRTIDVKTGQITAIANAQGSSGLKFSPDGRILLLQIISNNSGTARLIDFPSGRIIREMPNYWHYTFAAAFTPDSSQVVLMGGDRFIRRFDIRTGSELAKYEPAHTNSVREILISDDGKLIASCASSVGEIRVWDLQTARLRHQYFVTDQPNREQAVDSLAFAHGGRLLAGGGHPLVLWDIDTGNRLHEYPITSWGASNLRFSPDDKSLTAIHAFAGTARKNQELLVYPTVEQYSIEGVK